MTIAQSVITARCCAVKNVPITSCDLIFASFCGICRRYALIVAVRSRGIPNIDHEALLIIDASKSLFMDCESKGQYQHNLSLSCVSMRYILMSGSSFHSSLDTHIRLKVESPDRMLPPIATEQTWPVRDWE